MLGAQIGDQLSDLLIGERVGKGRHLLATVENLVGDFIRGPELIGANGAEVGAFLSAGASCAVAVGATFVAKQNGAGLVGGLLFGARQGVSGGCGEDGQGQDQETRKISNGRTHRSYFLMMGWDVAPSLVGAARA